MPHLCLGGILALAAFVCGGVDAFWRLPCKAPLVSQRADPIMSAGTVASHLHTIMGGNGFGFDMTYADTQASTCSSCAVTKDLSNYWVPSLYYKAENGTFIDVKQNGGGLIYYLQRSDTLDPEFSEGLLAFPEGFRMVTGDQERRSFNNSIEEQAISFACLGTQGAETNGLPNKNCPSGLRAQVFFPSCWDGINVDSPDHKSHMSYPSQYNSGHCPASHPKRFISLFYEVIWNTPDFADMWYGDAQPFVFSNGDPTGFGYHGDFINGWDVPTLQKAVNECTSPSGVIEECPVFDYFSDDVLTGCKIPASIAEKTIGNLNALPGCNTPQTGPTAALQKIGCGAPTTIGGAVANFADLTTSKGFAYMGCGYDPAGKTRTLNGATTSSTNMTNAICVDFCTSKGFTIAGTEYTEQCYCGNVIADDRLPTKGLLGNCEMACGGNSTEMCGGPARLSLYSKCGPGACANAEFVVNNRAGRNGTVPAVSSVSVVPASGTIASTFLKVTSTALSAGPAVSVSLAAANVATTLLRVTSTAAAAAAAATAVKSLDAGYGY